MQGKNEHPFSSQKHSGWLQKRLGSCKANVLSKSALQEGGGEGQPPGTGSSAAEWGGHMQGPGPGQQADVSAIPIQAT